MRLIDADALYKFIQDQKVKETGAYTKGKNTAFNIVKSALHNECATPTIEAEPVKYGRWVHDEDYEEWAERYVCSVCNRNALTDGDYRHELSPYCPNCGAKMEE